MLEKDLIELAQLHWQSKDAIRKGTPFLDKGQEAVMGAARILDLCLDELLDGVDMREHAVTLIGQIVLDALILQGQRDGNGLPPIADMLAKGLFQTETTPIVQADLVS